LDSFLGFPSSLSFPRFTVGADESSGLATCGEQNLILNRYEEKSLSKFRQVRWTPELDPSIFIKWQHDGPLKSEMRALSQIVYLFEKSRVLFYDNTPRIDCARRQ
jgi:hypothetical protein